MTDTKHTPGPWTYFENDRHVMSQGYEMPSICQTPKGKQSKNKHWQANARLIAAAPDLLEALELSLNFIQNTESEMGVELTCGVNARAAIAKAKGKTE